MTHYFLGVSGSPVLGKGNFFAETVRYQNCCCKKPKVMFVPTSHFWLHPGKQDPGTKGVVGRLEISMTPQSYTDWAMFFLVETPRHTLLENGLRVVNIFDPNTTQVGLVGASRSPKITISPGRWPRGCCGSGCDCGFLLRS